MVIAITKMANRTFGKKTPYFVFSLRMQNKMATMRLVCTSSRDHCVGLLLQHGLFVIKIRFVTAENELWKLK